MTAFLPKSRLPILQSQVIERPRLLDKLQSTSQRKLTLVVAPPGYGKTTAVTQYAQHTRDTVLWHTVEERERDLPSLYEHCLTTLSTAVKMEGLKFLPGTAPAEAATLITDHLRSALSSDIIYIFDDVHHLMGSPSCEHWLRTFIRTIPSSCHIILIGRALPPLPMIEMVGRGEVLAVGQDLLQFNFQEIQQLAEQCHVPNAPLEVQTIISRFDGWPAGTVLALQPLPESIEAAIFNGQGGPEALFNALAEVLFNALEPALQDFLLVSSILTLVSPELCQNALQTRQSSSYLAQLLQRNLFATRVPGGVKYHPLFRSFLQHHFESFYADRFNMLNQRAAHWFEESNQLEQAFDHYINAHQWYNAVAIAKRAAQVFVSQGKTETVLYWRSQLDQSGIEYPQLLYTCASIHVRRSQFDIATGELDRAATSFKKQGDELGFLKVALLQANIDNLRGQYRLAIERTDALLVHYDVPENLRAYSLSIKGVAHVYLGESDLGVQELETALPLYREAGDAYATSGLLLSLEFAHMRVGQFEIATTHLKEAIELARLLDNATALIEPLNNLGYNHHLLGDYQQALVAYQEGLQIARRVGADLAKSHILWGLGDLARDQGAFDEAVAYYCEALRDLGSNEPFVRSNVLNSLATLRRWQGRLEEASNLAKDALTVADHHGLQLEQIKAHLSIWVIRGQENEAQVALRELEQLAMELKQQHAQTRWAQALALCAHLALLQQDMIAADGYLKAAIAGVAHEASLQPSIAEILHSPLLRNFILGRSSQYPALSNGVKCLEVALGEARRQEVQDESRDSTLVYTLRVWTLGQERFERDGVTIPIAAWRSADARELFFYLLLKGPATHEQLGLILWPDSSAQQVRQKFHSTLHRARHAVGTKTIRFENDHYFLDPNIHIWCDAVELEGLVHEARLTSPLRVHTENLWQRAIDLYRGEFLPSLDIVWLSAHREALQLMHLEALFSLGNCIRARGNIQGALAAYQRAAEIDPYREDLHRAILTCYSALGERSSVLNHLQRLTQLLDDDLGIPPSLETMTLAQTLLA